MTQNVGIRRWAWAFIIIGQLAAALLMLEWWLASMNTSILIRPPAFPEAALRDCWALTALGVLVLAIRPPGPRVPRGVEATPPDPVTAWRQRQEGSGT